MSDIYCTSCDRALPGNEIYHTADGGPYCFDCYESRHEQTSRPSHPAPVHCISCDALIKGHLYHLAGYGPYCWLCYGVLQDNQKRKATAMPTETAPRTAGVPPALSASPEEAIQAVIDRSAIRIPTTNRVIFAGRITADPDVRGANTSMVARFQVANEDPIHPAYSDVIMHGPAAAFCLNLRAGQAVVIDGRIGHKVLGSNCLVTFIVATFIEPLQ